MPVILGIDPGKTGAIALVDEDQVRATWDMPTTKVRVGSSRRDRVDALALKALFSLLAPWADMAVIEAVGGRPKQSAASGFVFGFSTGLCYGALLYAGLRVETVQPSVWKKAMKVPGKANSTDGVWSRASELWPGQMHLFEGAKGGRRVDRAEAAMLAEYGLRHMYRRDQLTGAV